jgi:cytochrome c biogenesis protein CcmG, thiol:disulfide interchange protein DsbE
MNRKVFFSGLAVIVPLIVILGLGLGRDPRKVRTPMVGRDAPTFTLPIVGTNEALSLEEQRGRPVVVNFWATWCVPCYAEHDVLTRAATAMGENVQFIGVVYEDEDERVLEFLRKYGSAYPSVRDTGSRTAIAYGVYGVPETFFINEEGTIIDKFEGPLNDELLAGLLQRLRRPVS